MNIFEERIGRASVERHTIGDFIRAVFSVKTEDDARRFYEGAVAHYRAHQPTITHTPEEVAKANIGWCFGEGMADDMVQMWVKACGASHPIFGSSKPTPEEALHAGLDAGKRKMNVALRSTGQDTEGTEGAKG